MPRVAKFKPQRLVEIEERAKEYFGSAYATQTAVGAYLGIKNHSLARQWLTGVEYIQPGKAKLYAVDKIAYKLYMEETVREI